MLGTLIAALEHRGLSVSRTCGTKGRGPATVLLLLVVREVIDQPDAGFQRILCFEPAYRGKATEADGDIFRSIIRFTTGQPPINSIAMPLVATGDQGEDRNKMLRALVDAAVHWLNTGMPLDRINIVLHSEADLDSLEQTFAEVTSKTTVRIVAHSDILSVGCCIPGQKRLAYNAGLGRPR